MHGKVTIGVPSMGRSRRPRGRKWIEVDISTCELVPRGAAATRRDPSQDFGSRRHRRYARQLWVSADEPRLDPSNVVISVKFGVARNRRPSGS